MTVNIREYSHSDCKEHVDRLTMTAFSRVINFSCMSEPCEGCDSDWSPTEYVAKALLAK